MRSSLVFLALIGTCLIPAGLPLQSRQNSTELYSRAAAQARGGDIDGAVSAFREVLEVNEYYALGHYGLGRALLYKEEKLNEAIRHLRLSVTYDRRLARGHFYLGLAYMLAGKYENALHAFANAYEYDREILEALFNMAVIYDLMKVDYKADRYFQWYVYEKRKQELDILF